jgi:hypothetical protein
VLSSYENFFGQLPPQWRLEVALAHDSEEIGQAGPIQILDFLRSQPKLP